MQDQPIEYHPSVFGPLDSLVAQTLLGQRTLERRIEVGALLREPTPVEAPQLLLNRLLDGTIGRPQWEPRRVAKPNRLTTAALQAESAGRIDGAAVDNRHSGFRGTGYVDYANASGDLVEWTLDVQRAGRRTLHIRYALERGDRPLDVLVDGKVVVPALSMPNTGGWTTWAETNTAFHLQKGVHTIGLRAAGQSGPNVDEIRIE